MSEALGVLYEWCAARQRQIQTRLCRVRLHDGRAMSHLSNVLTGSGSCPEAGPVLSPRPLT